jgi:hypothetical protein
MFKNTDQIMRSFNKTIKALRSRSEYCDAEVASRKSRIDRLMEEQSDYSTESARATSIATKLEALLD